MSERRYGPSQGAGTSVTERDAEKAITPSTTGCTLHVGVFERGAVGQLTSALKKKNFDAKLGSRLVNGYIAPDAALDFYDTSEGAGELWCVRVTDGNEAAAAEYLYNRRVPRSAVVKVLAHDGGRWAGARAFLVGEMATHTEGTLTVPTLTETTLATGKTMLKDYWAGATLALKGVPTKSYVVLGNTVDGVISVISDAEMLTDYEAAQTADLEYALTLANGKRLEVLTRDGTQSPTEEWAIEVYLSGVLEYTKDNLSSDPTSAHYFLRAINDDVSNFSITVQDLWTGGYAADVRPANHYEQLVTLSDTVAKVEIMQARNSSAGSGNASVGGYQYGQSLKAQTLTVTFLSPTTYNVVSDKFGALNSSPVSAGDRFTPDFGTDYVPSFVISEGTVAMAEDDTITILVRPLVPNELTGGLIFPDKAGHRRTFYIIESNTIDTITAKIDSDMLTSASAGTKASVTGTAQGPTFDTSSNKTLKLSLDGGEEQTITLTSGGTTSAATIAADINTALGATVATVTTDNYVKLTSPIGGRLSKLIIGDGNANTALGFTDDTTYTGTVGDCAMLQWRQQLSGGYDGLASLADADYEAMYDVDSSPIKRMWGKHKGLVKLATPGVTSTSVQKAGARLAEVLNYQYRYEIPSNIVGEIEAEEYVNDTLGRSDFAVVAFPSYGYVKNPERNSTGFKLVSLSGAIHGREAKMAAAWKGYHKAAAGTDVTLPAVVALPTGDAVLDEESLNPQGIQIIKFYGADVIVWGDRTVAQDPTWQWKHQREQMSHYESVLRENFDWIIFALNDVDSWSTAWTELDHYFGEEKTNHALVGYTIKIDSENNTDATMGNGDANAEIRLKLPDTIERFNIGVSKIGIFESVGR